MKAYESLLSLYVYETLMRTKYIRYFFYLSIFFPIIIIYRAKVIIDDKTFLLLTYFD